MKKLLTLLLFLPSAAFADITSSISSSVKLEVSAAATAANSAAKTGGSVGGWSLSSTTITSGNITLDNANTRIVISD